MAAGSNIVCSVTFLTSCNYGIVNCFQTWSILGPKIIRGKIQSFEIIFFSLSYSGWTALHITLSEAQRQFFKAFQSLVSSVSSVQISLSACTVHWTVKVGGEWGGTVGLGVDRREWKLCRWFSNTGEYFPFLFFWWWVGDKGRDNYFVNKFSFPSSRCFLGSVQIAVLDVTFITMLYTVLFSLYSWIKREDSP